MSKTLKILVVDNTREPASFGSKELVQWIEKSAPLGSEIHVRRAPDQDLPPPASFDAFVFSGSITSCMEMDEPWITPFDDFVTQLILKEKPILGICYGHQAIARCLFKMSGKKAPLRRASDAELGWQTIERVGPSKLFDGLPERFVSFESHYEEIGELPPNTRLTAKTDRCFVQAFEHVSAPIFGVQFHPEYGVETGESSLAKKLKKGERRDWILNFGQGKALYNHNVGTIIFGNFFKLITNGN